jgi:hypothetical protein
MLNKYFQIKLFSVNHPCLNFFIHFLTSSCISTYMSVRSWHSILWNEIDKNEVDNSITLPWIETQCNTLSIAHIFASNCCYTKCRYSYHVSCFSCKRNPFLPSCADNNVDVPCFPHFHCWFRISCWCFFS